MKLFSGKLSKYQCLGLIIFCIIEIICFILLLKSYKPPYIKVFNKSKEISIEKTATITHTLTEILELSFVRYIQDLKLVGKHISFLSNNEINKNSQFYKNLINTKDKQIYLGTVEELKKNFSKYYDNNLKKFLFLESYINDYVINKTNKINILTNLMNKEIHPELNSISYYNINGTIDAIESNLEKKIATKYLISILKTNFIKRLSVKGSDFEEMNYFILTKDEFYIYPPEAYNNSLMYSIRDFIDCNNNFPQCAFRLLNEYINVSKFSQTVDEGYIFPLVPISMINYEQIVNSLCLNIPLGQKLIFDEASENPIICLEINMTLIFSKSFFQTKDAFNYFFVSILPNEIAVIYVDNIEMYSRAKKVFNDSKFKEFSISDDYNRPLKYFLLFHFLYLELFEQPELLKKNNISLDDIINEYYIIQNDIFSKLKFLQNSTDQYFSLDIEKTTCKSDIYNNGKKCLKDNYLLIFHPLNTNFPLINEFYIDHPNKTFQQTLFYSVSIISNNYNYMKWKIDQIILNIILKLFLFYFIFSICLIILFFIFVQIFFEAKYNPINQILQIIKGGSLFELEDKNEIIKEKEKILVNADSKEMLEIKNLFEYLIKTVLFKINFEQNENSTNQKLKKLKKHENNMKNQIAPKDNNNEKLNDFSVVIDKINNIEVRVMFSFIITYNHFRKGLFKLSENEFKNLIKEKNIYENKMSLKNENNDLKLKDTISRCSKISYLNEYSLTNELSDTMLPLIKAKLLTQKIYYFYAMSIFNQEKKIENVDKKYNKENAKKRYEEAIKYFIESKNISLLLGTNTIRQIFSLIMISKCFIELKNYKDSMINLNEALLLFSDLQKTFKDKPYFNPKIMMFPENYIFQSIMLTMAQTTYSFNKYPQSGWILMKMMETSPFVFNNIHFQAGLLLYNCLCQIEKLYNLPFRQTDRFKNKIYKLFTRINVKIFNKEKLLNNNSRNDNTNSNNNISSIPSVMNIQGNNWLPSFDNLMNSSNFKKFNKNNKDMYTNKFSVSVNSFSHFPKNQYKNITLCISEKLLEEINGIELEYVLFKFFKKSFSNGIQEDKFNFIQFSCNGKKTVSIKSNSVEMFLQKLEVNKLAFKINDIYNNKTNNQIQFTEFSNLFLNIIKSNKQVNYDDRVDNIIILFINTSDIRFNGEKECVDTINELNNNNYSVIIFTYDLEIEKEKIEGIFSFVYGLNDGHFFQVKNYQQIKQVFMNFCVKDYQEKFYNYNYDLTDFML